LIVAKLCNRLSSIVCNPRLIPIRSSLTMERVTCRNQRWVTDDDCHLASTKLFSLTKTLLPQ
jgi:hypothetical protein